MSKSADQHISTLSFGSASSIDYPVMDCNLFIFYQEWLHDQHADPNGHEEKMNMNDGRRLSNIVVK